MKAFILFTLLFLSLIDANAQKKIALVSPDKKIKFEFVATKENISYSIRFIERTVIEESQISFEINNTKFGRDLSVGKILQRKAIENYELTIGKNKSVADPFNELIIPLESERFQVNLVVRLFNDGVGLRYEFISSKDRADFILNDERTTFKFADETIIRTLFVPDYLSSHEGRYSTKLLTALKEGALMDLPTLFETPGKVYVAITESSLIDYPGMYLTKERGTIRSMLSPLPGQTAIKAKGQWPHKSPWRVIMISEKIGDLIESDIITNLSDPLAIKDVSWIRPGKTTFPWWNGNVVPDTLNAPGNNFITQKYYIDFCARNKIEYHSVVEYGLHQWYRDDGVSFSPGPHSDVTKPVSGLDMKQVCDYANSKGVGIRVWVHWAALYPKLDSAFAIFEQWGIKGMMIDFMNRDDQEMVNIQNEMVQKAAKHHLHIQFHGAYKPTGNHRTYPNEFTREATLNYEINKWDASGLSPKDDIMILFTRMLAGSTDYHLGGFRAVLNKDFVKQYTRPVMLGTRCHQLAMYVVLENYLGMVCDYPDAYEGQPGFEFIQNVPTVFDETKVLIAEVGEFILVARRKGSDWFVGGITGGQSKSITIPLNFLSSGSYEITIYSDGNTDKDPNHLNTEKRTVKNGDTINLTVNESGGTAMIIRKKSRACFH